MSTAQKIIDCRNRPNTREYLGLLDPKAMKAFLGAYGFSPPKEDTIEGWVRQIDESGITKAVFTGRDYETAQGWKVSNDYIASAANRYPEKVIGIAGLDALQARKAMLELERAVKELGLKGASLDHAACGIPPNDKTLYPIYEKCLELDVPVFFTMGAWNTASPIHTKVTTLKLTSPLYIDEIALDFPELRIVCAHGIWPFTQDIIAVCFRHRNVYVETSGYETFPGTEMMWYAANTIISDKVVFGTAYPFMPMNSSIAQFQKLPLTPETMQKVMYSNAARLLKLEP